MGASEINQFITYLVTERKISASTQNQALSAVLFLYRHVLKIKLYELSQTLIVRVLYSYRIFAVITFMPLTSMMFLPKGVLLEI